MTGTTQAAAASATARMVSWSGEQPLLSNGQHFSTGDYHVARRYIRKSTHGLFDLSLGSAREFRQYEVRRAQLEGAGFTLVGVDSTSGYDIEMPKDPDIILLHVLLRGRARLQQGSARADAEPEQMVLLETKAPSHKRWRGSTQLLMVRLSRNRLERIVVSETGISIDDPLSFGVLQVLDLKQVSTLWNYIVTICQDLSDSHPCFHGHAGRLAERTLSLLLLNAVPNNYKWAFSADTHSRAAPHYVRRVEEYIRRHATEGINAADLVKAGGASARSVYYGFRRFRSSTPMGYLKAVRLDLARQALLKGHRHGPNSVTQAAISVGYSNLGQFSRDYKARFRESPSQTLANA